MSSEITRRGFVAAGAAGVACAGLPAVAHADEAAPSADWRQAPAPVSDDQIAETVECEVLVIGLSYAGSSALRAAAEQGAKVVGIEAQTQEDYRCMGAGHFGHINSQFLAARGVPEVDPLEYFTNWQLRSANRSNPALCMKMAKTSGEAFDWYVAGLTDEERASIEVQFLTTPDTMKTTFSGLTTYVGTASTAPVQAKILQSAFQMAQDLGAQIMWGTRALQLVVEDGAVVGAVAEGPEGIVKVLASKGVVVAAGDYTGDPEMTVDVCTHLGRLMGDELPSSFSGYKGDGLKMCYWAGGKIDPYQACMGGDYYYPCDTPFDPIGSTAALWVNADGKRYCNEGFGFMEWSAFAGAEQPQGIVATVFDSNIEAQILAQAPCHMGVDYANGGLDGLQDLLNAAYAGGPDGSGDVAMTKVFAADDIETLGSYLGYEGAELANFVATVERYNEMCAAGRDEDFAKDPKLLFPIAQPPFYAYAGQKTLGHMLCTVSGVLIDENGQVLGSDYRPIKGLFAAGNTAGSRFGIQYTTAACGVSVAFAVIQGKFTGEYVAGL